MGGGGRVWGGGGQGGCERISEAFVKIQKKKLGREGGGSGVGLGGQGGRGSKAYVKIQKNIIFFLGGGVGWVGGQGGCERRREAFVKIQKMVGASGWVGCERRSEVFMNI